MGLSANTKLGPYVVLGPLKSGGMGEVYRAHDCQLDRVVALKVLRADLVGDSGAIIRFQREAKLASSLNHPHIISIYSTHESDGLLCIAMELVDGETLSEWQKNQKPSLSQLLEVFVQIADALACAHSAGIVHRDIKPSNLLINRQGYAKVLDFGLAKHVIPEGGNISQVSTNITGASDVLGTPAYMSPEQAKGELVDARTDIFSLCVVLYEAVTGVRPFAGDSVVQLLHAVITDEPRSAREINPSLPAELQWLLERGLAKKVHERIATMGDLAVELRRVRTRADSGVTSASSKRSSWRLGLIGVFALALVATFGVYWTSSRSKILPTLKYEQLTDFNDAATAPALSPDGRMLAFVRGGFFGGSAVPGGEIYIKLLPNGDPIRLTHDGTSKHTPTFSPDGTRVLYTRLDKNFTWDTWQVPVLGGETTPYLPNASGLTFIGTDEIMFAEIKSNPHMGIMTSRINRVAQRQVYMPPEEGSMAHRAALSPDREWVLLAEMDGSGWLPCRIVPFDGSSSGRQVGPLNGQCTVTAWSPDGEWMYFSSNAGGAFHIWRQAFPNGEPEQLTAEASEQEGLAIASDGKSLITAVGTGQSSIWLHDKQGDRQLTFQGLAMQPTMTPDGGTVFFLQRGGASRSYMSGELWRLDLKSGNRERVLPGMLMAMYDLSPDGRRIVFVSAEGTTEPGIWIADLNRLKPPQQLTKGGEFRAFFAGNDEIVYQSNAALRFVYAMKPDGSAKRQLNDTAIIHLINVSPDGEWAAVAVPQADEGTIVNIIALRQAIPPVRICHGCAVGFGPARQDASVVNWSADGKTVMVPMRFFGMSRRTIAVPFDAKHPDFDRDAHSEADYRALPGSRVIDERDVFPTVRPGEYLMARRSSSTNLFRVTLPQ